MAKISATFALNLEQPELDLVDVELDADNPFFVDPPGLSQRVEEWFIAPMDEEVVVHEDLPRGPSWWRRGAPRRPGVQENPRQMTSAALPLPAAVHQRSGHGVGS